MQVARWLAVLVMAVASLTFAPPAAAATHVHWRQVEVRSGKDADRVSKRLRRYLKNESRHAKWGKHKRLELAADVRVLSWQDAGEVVRISVTVVGRMVGGQSVRSSIRIGGRPNERDKLEENALKIVASGLVVRLSNLARNTAPKSSKKAAAVAPPRHQAPVSALFERRRYGRIALALSQAEIG